MMKKSTAILACAIAACAALVSPSASAMTFTFEGGGSYDITSYSPSVSNPDFLLGGEVTYGLSSWLSFGGFFEHNFLQFADGSGGGDSFFGGVARLSFGFLSHVFLDGKAGLTLFSQGAAGSNLEFGFGFGLGYRMGLGPFDLSPRVGVRLVPAAMAAGLINQTMIDASLLFSFGF